jgi:acyl carrier protein
MNTPETSEVADYIAETMVGKLEVPPGAVAPDLEFDGMGLDSLVLVQLAVLLSRRYRIDVDDAELLQARTIDGAAAMVAAKAAETGAGAGARV